MTQSLIAQLSQKLSITAVKDIEVTGIVDDGAGGWVRSVRFYGSPASGTNKALILEVLLQSAEKTDLAITTPEIDF
ncbi:MAG: hypothetical protein IOC86_03825 [Aestuariivirga sp.]|nr:hypothetical protein [Aestuariivirga sp.]